MIAYPDRKLVTSKLAEKKILLWSRDSGQPHHVVNPCEAY